MAHQIESFFHEETFTFTHLLVDEGSGKAALIDPVLDFDQKSGRTSTGFIDAILNRVSERKLSLQYVLETHAHADHLTSADYIRGQTGAAIVIGSPITTVQGTFKKIFNEGERFVADGHQFDHLIEDGEELLLGSTHIKAIATPGHTPACHSLLVNDSDVFVGDTIFAPDVGSARCDFPGGDAGTLWDSVHKLMALGDDVVIHLCHDYPPEGRPVTSAVTVGEQRRSNIHMKDDVSRDEFIRMRSERDAGLEMPRLILPSLQVNIRAGALPEAEDNGVAYLKLPLNLL
ncbi:MAG: MBL fold metallo-hydrolase [Oceanospirillaceae bacterium]|uniref:MBL fold metallo-hydrolase n=1 Tax=unclassified Thalassolituus TaxID=2624967 RepID=UPI000C4CA461|nr:MULTISPECIES: MBL fold metallo-hydrolase [unclassified Thalassolituus]MAS25933.1 MBL fold metallo-hydrolase [Oceanospirillaceae bacterium]MAY01283.1 MBL fold metallo-hydrolase [Oceanospirillaceae bacterium]MBS53233.1 MBL fold metallo-hydrolase [Oceanospirillaceae bacterium]|tara:strand:+ start:238 stop:1101 length:864 start_codon:yes stop_codon:yes gene_type:complete